MHADSTTAHLEHLSMCILQKGCSCCTVSVQATNTATLGGIGQISCCCGLACLLGLGQCGFEVERVQLLGRHALEAIDSAGFLPPMYCR